MLVNGSHAADDVGGSSFFDFRVGSDAVESVSTSSASVFKKVGVVNSSCTELSVNEDSSTSRVAWESCRESDFQLPFSDPNFPASSSSRLNFVIFSAFLSSIKPVRVTTRSVPAYNGLLHDVSSDMSSLDKETYSVFFGSATISGFITGRLNLFFLFVKLKGRRVLLGVFGWRRREKVLNDRVFARREVAV